MMKQSALEYLNELKKPVIPVCWPGHGKISNGHDDSCQAKGKRPLIKDWQRFCFQLPTKQEVIDWFTRWPDANVGGPTGPIWGFALDVDPRHGGDSTIEHLEIPCTVTSVTGGGGYHFLFKHFGIEVANKVSLKPGIDIRGDGGYIVLPPSRHSSGKPYQWVEGKAPDETVLAIHPPWIFPDDDTKTKPGPSTHANTVIEGNRRTTLVSLAGSMLHKGMSKEAIEAALYEENRIKCYPNLPASEVFEIVQDITTRYRSGSHIRPSLNFIAPDLWIDSQNEPVRWLINGLLAKGSLTMISAPPKVGKSTFTRALSAAVSTGNEFLEREVDRGSVLYMALEERPEVVQDSFRRLGIMSDSPISIHFGRVGIDVISELQDIVHDTRPSLLVVDTIARIRSNTLDISNYVSVGDWLEPLLYMAHESDTCVCVLYHDNKSGRDSEGYEAVNSILGSTAVGATVDQIISLRREKSDRRTFQSIGRFPDIPKTVFELDDETQRLILIGNSNDLNISSKKEAIENAIISLLQKRGKIGREEIGEKINARTQVTLDVLNYLVKQGLVNKTGLGKSGSPYFYALAGERTSSQL